MKSMQVRELFEDVFKTEISALTDLLNNFDDSFFNAVDIIQKTSGRVIVIGMGKSGIIGRKIAATFASTGTSSFFVHPGEAFHGDLGMISPQDVALLISYSGETEELIRLIPFLKWQKNSIISITGRLDSTLAKNSDASLNVFVKKEACLNNLAPTCSTTATLVMGDALAVTLSKLRNFQPEDFARFHPGGNLGKKLLTKVENVMKTNLPICSPGESFLNIVKIITNGRLGLCLVMDGENLLGIITDGDLRRGIETSASPTKIVASDIMTLKPKTISSELLLKDAEELIRSYKVSSLVVLNSFSRPVGILQVFDL